MCDTVLSKSFYDTNGRRREDRPRFAKCVVQVEDPANGDLITLGHVRDAQHEEEYCKNCSRNTHKTSACPDLCVNMECRKCGGTGHKASDCDTPKRGCTVCESSEHQSDTCPNIQCNKCHGLGHKAKQCPGTLQPEESEKRCENCLGEHESTCCPEPCHNCRQEGHTIAECENPPNAEVTAQAFEMAKEGKNVDATSNTGKDTAQCLNCQASDHEAADCSQPCRRCGIHDHHIGICTLQPVDSKDDIEESTERADGESYQAGVESPCQNCGEEGHLTWKCKRPCNRCGLPSHSRDKCGALKLAKKYYSNVPRKPTAIEVLDAKFTMAPDGLGLTFKTHDYGDSTTPPQIKEASLRMLWDNLVGRKTRPSEQLGDPIRWQQLNVESIDLQNPTLAKVFGTKDLDDLRRDLEIDPVDLRQFDYYKLSFQYHGQDVASSESIRRGVYFFTPDLVQERFPDLVRFRDILHASQEPVIIHVYIKAEQVEIANLYENCLPGMRAEMEHPLSQKWLTEGWSQLQYQNPLSVEDGPDTEQRPIRVQFDSKEDYLCSIIHGAKHERDRDEEAGKETHVEIRLLSIPGQGENTYMVSLSDQKDFNKNFRRNTKFQLRFSPRGDIWTGTFAKPATTASYIPETDIGCFINAPMANNTFLPLPDDVRDEVVDVHNYTDLESLKDELHNQPAIQAIMWQVLPTNHWDRIMRSVMVIESLDEYQKAVLQTLVGNDLIDMDKKSFWSYLVDIWGEDAVDKALQIALAMNLRVCGKESLDPSQTECIEWLKQPRGPIGLVKGRPGTGKTFMNNVLALLPGISRRVLTSSTPDTNKPQPPGTALVVTPTNANGDAFVDRIRETLAHASECAGIDPETIRVVRMHAMKTERHEFKLHGETKRQENGNGEIIRHYQDLLDPSILRPAIAVRNSYEDTEPEKFDRRFTNKDQSLLGNALQVIGCPDANGRKHVTAVNSVENAELLTSLTMIADGHVLSKNQLQRTSLLFDRACDKVLESADVVVVTPSILADWENGPPFRTVLLIVDEAQNASEGDLLSVMQTPRGRRQDKETGACVPSCGPYPILLSGDETQLYTYGQLDHENKLPFEVNLKASLFVRLLVAGVPSFTLRQQHRVRPQIEALTNNLIGQPTLPVEPEAILDPRPLEMTDFLWRVFRRMGPLMVVQVRTQDDIQEEATPTDRHQSKYNNRTCVVALLIVAVLVSIHEEGYVVAWIVFYSGQEQSANVARNKLVDELMASEHEADHELARKLQGVVIGTIDKLQGQEFDDIVVEIPTIDGKAGFLGNRNRLNSALTRSKNLVIVIVDILRYNSNSKRVREDPITLMVNTAQKAGCCVQWKSPHREYLHYLTEELPDSVATGFDRLYREFGNVKIKLQERNRTGLSNLAAPGSHQFGRVIDNVREKLRNRNRTGYRTDSNGSKKQSTTYLRNVMTFGGDGANNNNGRGKDDQNDETWNGNGDESWGKENDETWGKENDETWGKENDETWGGGKNDNNFGGHNYDDYDLDATGWD